MNQIYHIISYSTAFTSLFRSTFPSLLILIHFYIDNRERFLNCAFMLTNKQVKNNHDVYELICLICFFLSLKQCINIPPWYVRLTIGKLRWFRNIPSSWSELVGLTRSSCRKSFLSPFQVSLLHPVRLAEFSVNFFDSAGYEVYCKPYIYSHFFI